MLGFLFCFVCVGFYCCCVFSFVVLGGWGVVCVWGGCFLMAGGGSYCFCLVGWLFVCCCVLFCFWGVKCTKLKQIKKCVSILAIYLHYLQSDFKPQASCFFFSLH